jgi:hypothetical protein
VLELTFEELEGYIDEISTGSKVVEIEDGNKNISVLIFQHPKSKDKLIANLIYKQIYNKAIEEGLFTNSQMKDLLEERGILKESDSRKIESIKKKLEAQRVLLAKTTKVRANKERILGVIKSLEADLKLLIWQRERNFGLTAESKAQEDKLVFLCRKYVYKSEGELLWETEEAFNLDTDSIFRTNVFTQYSMFVMGLSTDIIRLVARSNLWRIRYVTALKCGCDLFGIPAVDFSTDMTNLLYWSHFYQNVYEMIEDQPGEDIIEDDSALDAYMENYYKEMKNKQLMNRSSKSGIDAMNSEQVIITPSHELHKDIEYDKPREAQRLKGKEVKDMPDRSPRKKRKRK